MSMATKKFKWTIKVKLKAKALQHFKVDQVLKIDATFFSILDLCVLNHRIFVNP